MEEKNKQVFPRQPGKTYGLMALIKKTSPMVQKGPEDTVFSWPHLMVMELLAVLATTLFLLFISILANAPLREVANPDVTENPAKAPWFFSNLQELLLHMAPALAGVILPLVVILALMAIPYFDRRQEDVGIWFASKKAKAIAVFATIYTTIIMIALIFFDEFIGVRTLFPHSEVLTGWVVPIGGLGILSAVLYLGMRRWRPNLREVLIGFFTAFVVTYLITTISTQFFRGLGMHLTPPWRLPPGGLTF